MSKISTFFLYAITWRKDFYHSSPLCHQNFAISHSCAWSIGPWTGDLSSYPMHSLIIISQYGISGISVRRLNVWLYNSLVGYFLILKWLQEFARHMQEREARRRYDESGPSTSNAQTPHRHYGYGYANNRQEMTSSNDYQQLSEVLNIIRFTVYGRV